MPKIKDYICKNRKIIILAAIVIILLIAACIYFILHPSTDTGAQQAIHTQRDPEISKEENAAEVQQETNQTAEPESKPQENTETEETENKSQENNEPEEPENNPEMNQENDSAQAESELPEADSSDTTDKNSSSNSSALDTGSEDTSHTHVWKAHTVEEWVPNIVTVVDQPAQTVKYSIYRMYWYTTGVWEETRDAERFDTWYKSKDGGLYPLYHPYKKPEDNPLFIEYDKNGNPTYINDHVIAGPYYETIPPVTHEEDQGHYETYTDYYYCDCGATKQG